MNRKQQAEVNRKQWSAWYWSTAGVAPVQWGIAYDRSCMAAYSTD